MAAHPEWTEWWERGDDVGDANPTVNGVSPYLTIAIEAAVEGMIGRTGDKYARRAYRQLRKEGFPHKAAREEIARALTGVFWETGKGRVEDGARRLREVFKRIANGETAEEIFSVYEANDEETDPVG